MRYRVLTGLILAAVFLAAGCRGGEAGQEESVSVSGLDEIIRLVPAPEDPLQFEIASNVGWSIVKKDLDWLTITPLRRLPVTEHSTVTLTAMPNTSPDARRGTFEITAGEKFKRTVTVEQAGTGDAPLLIVSGIEEDAIWFSADDTPRTLTLSSNRDWTATAQGLDWCTISPLKGARDRIATITVKPDKNEGEPREGRLSFDCGADAPYEIVIGQAGFDAVIAVSTETVRVSDIGRCDPAAIVVTSNGSWTATSSASWLTLDKLSAAGDETVTPIVDINESEEARSATLTFDNHGEKAVVTVTQNGKIVQYLTVSPKTVELPGKGTGVTVEVSANTAWRVTSTESWITVSPASGTGNGVITISASVNTSLAARTATVTVASTEVELLAEDIAVSQETYVDPSANGVDLYTEKMVWPCNNQAWAKQTSPDFAHADQNGAVSGAGTGVFYPNSHAETPEEKEKYYAKFVRADNGKSYTTTFIISVEGNFAFKDIWDGDAIEFHMPVLSIQKESILHFDFGLQATAATAAYYRAEASFDGGNTWNVFNTGNTYTPATGLTANAKIASAKTPYPFHGTLSAPVTLSKQELIVRIVVVSSSPAINNKTYSKPSGGTLRLVPDTSSTFIGPTVYVTTE